MCKENNTPIITDEPKTLAAKMGVKMIRMYQVALSPLLPAACRFSPSCSQFTLIAVKRFGFFKGCFLGFKRIGRCHPFHEGGYDPVPKE